MSANRQPLTRATNDRPCPVCKRTKSCSWTPDGLHFCFDKSADHTIWKEVKRDPTFSHYRRLDDCRLHKNPTPVFGPSRPAPPPAGEMIDWEQRAIEYAGNLTDALKAELVEWLGLPDDALDPLPLVGWKPKEKAYTFPELDAAGTIIAIKRRFTEDGHSGKTKWKRGDKFTEYRGDDPRSGLGLTLPVGWDETTDPLYLVEGASGTLAMTAAGLKAVGRPSKDGGLDYLRDLLRSVPPERPIVVVGDNDKRANGSWPGRDGAKKTADYLAANLGRVVFLTMPPAGMKDVRDWLIADDRQGIVWPGRGADLEPLLLDPVEVVTPPADEKVPAVPRASVVPEIVDRKFSDITPTKVSWVWPSRIPLGMMSILDGDPSLGKSLITLDLAARLSRGWCLPSHPGKLVCEPANTAILAAEDSADSVIRPRLEAAGADLDRCRCIDGVTAKEMIDLITLPDDNPALENYLRERDIRMLVIDPLMSYLAAKIDANGDKDVRKALTPLKLTAERTGTAVVCLRHLNKGGTGNALNRGMGSVAIGAAARSVLFAAKHPTEPDTNVLAISKCNLTKKPASLLYRITTTHGEPTIDWLGECDLDANDLTGPTERGGGGSRLLDAEAWLRDVLANGPVTATQVFERGKSAGYTDITLKRAKKKLNYHAYQVGFAGGWVWDVKPRQVA